MAQGTGALAHARRGMCLFVLSLMNMLNGTASKSNHRGPLSLIYVDDINEGEEDGIKEFARLLQVLSDADLFISTYRYM